MTQRLCVSAENLSDPSRSDALDAVLKASGRVKTLSDLEEEEQLLTLEACHELIVTVEFCNATRPSKLGSLKGSHAKYEEEFHRIEDALTVARGLGVLSVREWAADCSSPSSTARPRLEPAHSSCSSAQRLARQMGLSVDPRPRTAPRIGSFEVSFELRNQETNAVYGPVEVFSKIKSGHWPGSNRMLLRRVQEALQIFLQKDQGHSVAHAHVQSQVKKASVADATGGGNALAPVSPS